MNKKILAVMLATLMSATMLAGLFSVSAEDLPSECPDIKMNNLTRVGKTITAYFMNCGEADLEDDVCYTWYLDGNELPDPSGYWTTGLDVNEYDDNTASLANWIQPGWHTVGYSMNYQGCPYVRIMEETFSNNYIQKYWYFAL